MSSRIAAGLRAGQAKRPEETRDEWIRRTAAAASAALLNGAKLAEEEQEKKMAKAVRRARSPNGARSSQRLRTEGAATKVAAAEKAAQEITSAVSSWDMAPNYQMELQRPSYVFNVMTSANWRRITLHQGHGFTWEGKVRHAANGKLLFIVTPEMNSELSSRGATYAEVYHDELDSVFGPDFQAWACEQMGVESIDELIEQARKAVDPEDIAKAEAEAKQAAEQAEEERQRKERQKLEDNPVFGSWA